MLTQSDKNKLKRWSKEGQKVFKQVYAMMFNQEMITHPKQAPLPKDQWKTIAWNAAWLAADAADGK
jgi:hypothetical protein